jgi:hypothetical protein
MLGVPVLPRSPADLSKPVVLLTDEVIVLVDIRATCALSPMRWTLLERMRSAKTELTERDQSRSLSRGEIAGTNRGVEVRTRNKVRARNRALSRGKLV